MSTSVIQNIERSVNIRIISGTGILNIDGESRFVSKGDFFTVPIGSRYCILPSRELEWLEE